VAKRARIDEDKQKKAGIIERRRELYSQDQAAIYEEEDQTTQFIFSTLMGAEFKTSKNDKKQFNKKMD
jgi:hypothetical protein